MNENSLIWPNKTDIHKCIIYYVVSHKTIILFSISDDFIIETVVGSNEIISDETSYRNFGESSQFSMDIKRSPIELHNAWVAAGTLVSAIFMVALIVSIIFSKS